MREMMESADKDMKTAIINMFHNFRKTEEKMAMMMIGVENMKKTQMKLMEETSEIKNTKDEINRLNIPEDHEVKNIAVITIQNEG